MHFTNTATLVWQISLIVVSLYYTGCQLEINFSGFDKDADKSLDIVMVSQIPVENADA
jgi:hypothetical protein